MNIYRRLWYEEMVRKGHTPKMSEWDPAELDIFVMDADIHNGPGCTTCGWSICMHCAEPKHIPSCRSE